MLLCSGAKSTKVVWIDGQRGNPNMFITTGFTRVAARELKVWDIRTAKSPHTTKSIDTGSGFLLPHWEESTGLLFIVPKVSNCL